MLGALEEEKSAPVNIATDAPDKGKADDVLKLEDVDSPRAKKALKEYVKHLEKSKNELELEFID